MKKIVTKKEKIEEVVKEKLSIKRDEKKGNEEVVRFSTKSIIKFWFL